MNNKKQIQYTLDKITDATDSLYELLDTCSVFTFTGDLGAGKTTLVRALLRRCGVVDLISSPTFTYVSVYTNAVGQKFYHFDLYRIKSIHEFFELGLQEFLYKPNSYAFIEWPEIILPLINKRACYITIEYADLNKRILTYKLSADIILPE